MSIDWKAYLLSQGAVFQGPSLTEFSSQPSTHPPQSPHQQKSTLSVLSHHSFVRVSGADAHTLLQGQISVHMDQLLPHQHSLGVACTPKGRMYSSFRLLHNDEDYLLSMESSTVEHTLATLRKYAVFFKSDLRSCQEMIALGLSGSHCVHVLEKLAITPPAKNKAVAIQGGYLLCIEETHPRFEFWVNTEVLPFWWEQLMPLCTPSDPSHWQLLDIHSVIPSVTQNLSEKYTPQHLNMPTLGGVSFRKGCYTGQEIVTRMQSLGQQKSRTYHLQAPLSLTVQSGDKVYDAHGKPIGEVLIALFSKDTQCTELLAVIRIEVAEQGQAYLDAQQKQPATVLPLPYPVDSKVELQQ